jgi:hypothetical protein
MQIITTTSRATPLPTTGDRTIKQLLEELNSIKDCRGQTVWFREHYPEIKKMQSRELCLRAQGGQANRGPRYGPFANPNSQRTTIK